MIVFRRLGYFHNRWLHVIRELHSLEMRVVKLVSRQRKRVRFRPEKSKGIVVKSISIACVEF